MKNCFKCGEKKARTEFYSHPMMGDGLLGKCKDCTKKDSAENTLRKQSDPQWVIKERKRQREKEAIRRKKGLVGTYVKGAYKRPEANNKVSYAMKTGMIKKSGCQVCGKSKAQAHHEDYSKPLDVVWLCTRHHADRHIHLRDMATLGAFPTPIHLHIEQMKDHQQQKTKP